MNVKIEDGKVMFYLEDLFHSMSDEDKKELLRFFTFEEIIPAIEAQLKHETELSWWCTNGEKDGGKLREKIFAMQGLEPEFKKDFESKIRCLENKVSYLKNYYKWYWKFYHHDADIRRNILSILGEPGDKKEVDNDN